MAIEMRSTYITRQPHQFHIARAESQAVYICRCVSDGPELTTPEMPLPEITSASIVYPASLPAIAPDFKFCSSYYGSGLIEDECRRAAWLLPYGSTQAYYRAYSSGNGDGALNSLPYSVTYGQL